MRQVSFVVRSALKIKHCGYRLLLCGALLVLAGCNQGGGSEGSGSGNTAGFTVSTASTSGGSLSPSSQSVDLGNTANLTVTPDSGYTIAAVTGCSGSLNGTLYTTGSITADCTVSASFVQTFTVSASAGAGGNISPSSSLINAGSSTALTLTPDNGYAIDMVTGCGGSLSGTTYTTGSITADCTVSASFIQTFTQANCPALGPATGNPVHVSNVSELVSAVNNAQSGDAILLADGVYALNGNYLWIASPNVELRSASGNRDAVVLDGNYQSTEIVTIAANNVTVADLTIREAYTHPIHVVTTGADVTGTLIYNVHITDPREQGIKINPGTPGTYVDDGVIACSTIELTDTGRPNVSGCYTGGVDAHQARGWVIRDNLIQGFWCDTGLSEHGVHCWRGCRDTVVERNQFIDNARGVGFGLATSGTARTFSDDPCPGVTGYVGHYGGIVRNNFIFASDPDLFDSTSGFDSGISFWSACNAKAVHNTIVSTGNNFSSIEWRFPNSVNIEVANNIVTHSLNARDGAVASLVGNLENASLSLFVNGSTGNLHLASGANSAINQGVSLAQGLCTDDIDGDTRDANPDVGADEY